MCLIFIKPKNAQNYLTYERFSNALTNNPHAVGIVYRDAEGINIERFVKPENYKEEIWNIIKDKEEFAIHFRYATHGILNLTNTHPFVVTKGLCMMHNGVMNDFGDLNKDWSDTKNFVEYFLKPYVEEEGIDVIKDESFKTDLEKVIGSGNKLLFIDNDFNFTIVNEKAGTWKDGCWLSNTYSVEPPYSSYYSKYAPSDGTAKTSKSSPRDYWSDYYHDYDGYDYYDDRVNLDSKFSDYYKEKYTPIYNSVGEVLSEIAVGVELGELVDDSPVPYELVIEPENITDEILQDISAQINNGAFSGTQPCMWELLVSMDDINNAVMIDDETSPF